jgi:hypothetical protein
MEKFWEMVGNRMSDMNRLLAIGRPLALAGLIVVIMLVIYGCNQMGMVKPAESPAPAPLMDEAKDEVMAYNTGLMYYKGEGVPQNFPEAANWFVMSAKKGYAPALYSLGHMYSRGTGLPQSLAQAFKHFSLAAEQGYPAAQFAVGYMYAKGQAVQQDKLLAHMWLNLAASANVTEAAALRDQIAKLMTPEEVSKAQRMAVEWSPSPPIGLPEDETPTKN